MNEPILLFGMCGCKSAGCTDLEFYKNINNVRDSYNYFNDCCESYEELISYAREYKNNWTDIQLDYLKQLEEIYLSEHKQSLPKTFVSLSLTFGIVIDNIIVGYIMLAKTHETMLIVEIFVKNEYRGQGIGTKLIEYVLSLYPDVSFSLHVSVMNIVAIQLYLKYKFIIISTIENYYKDINIEPYTDEGVNAYYMIRFAI